MTTHPSTYLSWIDGYIQPRRNRTSNITFGTPVYSTGAFPRLCLFSLREMRGSDGNGHHKSLTGNGEKKGSTPGPFVNTDKDQERRQHHSRGRSPDSSPSSPTSLDPWFLSWRGPFPLDRGRGFPKGRGMNRGTSSTGRGSSSSRVQPTHLPKPQSPLDHPRWGARTLFVLPDTTVLLRGDSLSPSSTHTYPRSLVYRRVCFRAGTVSRVFE